MYHHYNRSFIELLKRDRRYKIEAYSFVFETLEYAQNVLRLGKDEMNEPFPEEFPIENEQPPVLQGLDEESDSDTEPKHHISGQDLCRAARDYAIDQYGYLAKMVLDSIGIRKTDDIGEIVYNLISIRLMRKTPSDKREDFDNVFDFETAFKEEYRIKSNSQDVSH